MLRTKFSAYTESLGREQKISIHINICIHFFLIFFHQSIKNMQNAPLRYTTGIGVKRKSVVLLYSPCHSFFASTEKEYNAVVLLRDIDEEQKYFSKVRRVTHTYAMWRCLTAVFPDRLTLALRNKTTVGT